MAPSPKEMWRRAAAALKDKRSICAAMIPLPSACSTRPRWRGRRNPDVEAAVIRATSHSERSIDYKNARRVFSWARSSPSSRPAIMYAIAHRAERTRSWPVALKSLLLAHGLLVIATNDGRLPFDLADFRDRSSNTWGYSAFVRAYFQFLDNRAVLLSTKSNDGEGFKKVESLQTLLDLLMQIRPCTGGLRNGLIIEAMDCAVIEIFEVYSAICTSIASFLMGVLGSKSKLKDMDTEESKRIGMKAIRVLRRARTQSLQLTNYFETCRSLGVMNAADCPLVDRIPEEDIIELERFVLNGHGSTSRAAEVDKPAEKTKVPAPAPAEGKTAVVKWTEPLPDLIQLDDDDEEEEKISLVEAAPASNTVVFDDWVVFDDEFKSTQGYLGNNPFVQEYFGNNPFIGPVAERPWASMVHGNASSAAWNGNLIELM